jgi:ubiquinone/menaquinone biosynthesis C-methylase UbiE
MEINNCKTIIIDLGAGSGNDIKYLLEKGKRVIACDYSKNAIKNINTNFPEIEKAQCFDMTKGLPFIDNFTDMVIADLSLHYFDEKTTFAILSEIKRVLKPNGLLISRVYSLKDANYKTENKTEIEKHYYKTPDGRFRRFFDKADLYYFLQEFKMLYLEEKTLRRNNKAKEVWECLVKKDGEL